MTPTMSARSIWACCRSSRQAAQGGKGSFTYSASLNYKTDFGLVPYLTNAKSSAIEIGQASQVLDLAAGQ